MASLLTGVPADVHGVLSAEQPPRLPSVPLEPVPEILARVGLPSSAFVAETNSAYIPFVPHIADRLGLTTVQFVGQTAHEIVAAARHSLSTQHRGMVILCLPDLDVAGRKVGRMSAAYREAAQRLDMAIGLVAALAECLGIRALYS